MPSLRHTFTVTGLDSEPIGKAVIRMMTAAEHETMPDNLTDAQVFDILADRVESTTLDVDGDPYPDGFAARVEWFGKWRGPWARVAFKLFAQAQGVDLDVVPPPKS